MPIEDIKKTAETNRGRPALDALVRERKPNAFRFKDDGLIPNHPHWPLIIYRSAVRLPHGCDPAAAFEDLFCQNGWGNSWRDSIYGFVHYHSRIHEVLGIARGEAKVQFGGQHGRIFAVKAGDIAMLPAGTGHQCFCASKDFLVVGAYPPAGAYDECTKPEEHARAMLTIPQVPRPPKDPVYGSSGPLLALWKDAEARTH